MREIFKKRKERATKEECAQWHSWGIRKEKSVYLSELWPWWLCRCGRRPLPHPALHVFLTHSPSLTPSLSGDLRGRKTEEKAVKFLLMECQGEPGSDRGQMYHREIHPGAEKCMQEAMREFAILPHLLSLLTLPESQWTNEQLHHLSNCRACVLQQSCPVYHPPSAFPRDPTPHRTGTMSFLKVISSLALGQPSSWVHYTHSGEIHCLNTPLLVSPHCSAAPFTGPYKSSRGQEHTQGFRISLAVILSL